MSEARSEKAERQAEGKAQGRVQEGAREGIQEGLCEGIQEDAQGGLQEGVHEDARQAAQAVQAAQTAQEDACRAAQVNREEDSGREPAKGASDARSSKAEWKTTANLITIVRIILVPLFVAVLLAPWPEWLFSPGLPTEGLQYLTDAVKPWVAAIVYAALACTDGIDGYIARKNNEVTTLGKFLDPLADKILVAAALLCLIELGDLPSWPVIIIIAREFIVSGLRMMAATEGVVIAARMSGKVKTALTMVAIFMFIVKRSSLLESYGEGFSVFFYCLSWAVMAAALVATIVSMVQYSKQVVQLMSEASARREAREEGKGAADVAGEDELGLRARAAAVLEGARELGVHLATAESCTGGMIAASLTAVPGASDVFEGGVASYSYGVKEALLEVQASTLRECGAVSEEVALQMASGARQNLLADCDDDHALAVSTTGVAGPGPSEGKPAGSVWIGIAGRGAAEAHLFHFAGDRASVRVQASLMALRMAEGRLRGEAPQGVEGQAVGQADEKPAGAIPADEGE